jgi:hypothetical protein
VGVFQKVTPGSELTLNKHADTSVASGQEISIGRAIRKPRTPNIPKGPNDFSAMDQMIAESKPKTQKCIEKALFDKHYGLIMSGFNSSIPLQPLVYGFTEDGEMKNTSEKRIQGARREPIRDGWHKADTMCCSGKRSSSPETPGPLGKYCSNQKFPQKKTSIFKAGSSPLKLA